ncbi:hypothetical protein DFH06DRAFT_676633 [Mycena polygramma]|nr:hypothetical protein DFH06DRAFT_676633 [Mycena polygramma]
MAALGGTAASRSLNTTAARAPRVPPPYSASPARSSGTKRRKTKTRSSSPRSRAARGRRLPLPPGRWARRGGTRRRYPCLRQARRRRLVDTRRRCLPRQARARRPGGIPLHSALEWSPCARLPARAGIARARRIPPCRIGRAKAYPYRTSSDAALPSSSASTSASSSSYRMGVHVAAGHRRESIAGYGGADVVDRFVLPRSRASSLSSTAQRGSPASIPSPLSLREREVGGVTGTGTGMGFGVGGGGADAYGRPPPSEREREREREKGVPIAGSVGSASSGGIGGVSGSGPSVIALNPFKSSRSPLSCSSLNGSLLRSVAGSPACGGDELCGRRVPCACVPDAGVGIPMRRRYSSSFSQRYGAAAGSSAGRGKRW